MRLLIPCKEIPGCFDGLININHIVDLYVDVDFDCHICNICATTTTDERIVLCKSDYRTIKDLFEFLVGELSGNMTYGMINLEEKYKQIKEERKGE